MSNESRPWAAGHEALDYCYLTTTGRVSGEPRRIEIWFGTADGRTLYLMAGSGERANWVRNLRKAPAATVEIGGVIHPATGRVVADAAEDAVARRLLLEKYAPRYSRSLDEWGRTALPVALDLSGAGEG